jgi:hypothetical protein
VIETEALAAERAHNAARRGARHAPPTVCKRCGATPDDDPPARFRLNRRGYWHHVCAGCESEATRARTKGLTGEALERHRANRAAYNERRRTARVAAPKLPKPPKEAKPRPERPPKPPKPRRATTPKGCAGGADPPP